MISAFGVDHGDEVSKSLPSALRGRGITSGIGTQTIRQNNRVAAHQAGKKAAKYLSANRTPKPGSVAAGQSSMWMRSGKNQKEFFRQGLSGPGGRRLGKPNGFGLE